MKRNTAAIGPVSGMAENRDYRASAVLLFGYSKQKLIERRRALQEDGFRVISVSQLLKAEALLQSRTERFDFLVIGHSVPEAERTPLVKLYKEKRPDGNVVILYSGSIRNTQQASAVLSENRSPENLLETLHALERGKEFA